MSRISFCWFQLFSVHILPGASLIASSCFSLSAGRYEILTALIFESSRLINTREHDGYQYSHPSKCEIPNACSVAARPHLPPILWSQVANRSSSESTKLLLANGLISHPRCLIFPFPCLGSRWPHNPLLFIMGLSVSFDWPCLSALEEHWNLKELLPAISRSYRASDQDAFKEIGTNLSCSTIYSGICFFLDIRNPFPFGVFSPHLRFILSYPWTLHGKCWALHEVRGRPSRSSMLSATWPSLIRDPWWRFLPKRLLMLVLIPIFEVSEGGGQVYQPIV